MVTAADLTLRCLSPDASLNFGQATFFRTSGLLTSVLLRTAYYLVWHVLYGNFLIS